LRATRLQDREIDGYLRVSHTPVKLGLFIRYQTAAERSFHKAHTELLKAQKQRANSKIGFESKKSEVTPEAPPKSEPKVPQPPPPIEKIPFPAPAEPQEPNIEQEIAWLMSVTTEELLASNL